MISDIYTEEHGIEHILSETEKVGVFCGLHPADTGKLRLLAEEMLGLTVRLFENLSYEFFIEKTEWQRFTLNLSAAALVNQGQKEKLLSLSTAGKNKATKGFLGKISGIFNSLLMDSGEYERIYIPHYDGMGMVPYFSLAAYMDEPPVKNIKEYWDGLEKSIIAMLAKDMVIGVRNSKVEMVAVIKF
jgi:hypothetical protein